MKIIDRAQAFVPDLNSRKVTLREVAKVLDCNECYLCRVLSPQLKRIESSTKRRRKQAKLVESRKQMREKHANLVKIGQKTLKKGAADARCSERTLRRYIARLD